MAKRHFVYQGSVHGQETLVYYIENEETGKKQFFVLESVPEELQVDERGLERVHRMIKRYNEEKNKRAELVSLTDKSGRKQWFVKEPSAMIPALLEAMKVENEIKREQKRIDEMNENSTQRIVKSGIIQYKKPSNAKTMIIRAVAAGLTVLMLAGGAGILSRTVRGTGPSESETTAGIHETYEPEESTKAPIVDVTKKPDITLKPEVPAPPVKKPYTDLDTLTYKTHKNESGTEFLELADALRIAEACYNNLTIELGSVDHDYSFDPDKFNCEMFVAEAMAENSLKVIKDYVNQYGCRGMMMIGSDATKEANMVSKDLTGNLIIEDSKELDNPVEAMMTAMYIAVRNYEYCADIVGPENVTPEMVFDCYLYGCGNLRSWLRECKESGKPYQSKTYSKKILYYGECLEPYKDALDEGLTDGSHDKIWQDTYYNHLWKVPDFSAEQTEGIERE